MASKTKKVNRSTEDWLPIKAIENNVIRTYKNYKVTGVKITPRNIFILEPAYQENILISLKNFYNMIDFEFWLVVADRPVDISVYKSQLQLQLNNVVVNSVKKLVIQDLEKCDYFIQNNVVDTEYYILFKEEKDDILQKKIRLLINGLATCGLNAQQVSNDDLRVVLDSFLNGSKKTEFGTVIPV